MRVCVVQDNRQYIIGVFYSRSEASRYIRTKFAGAREINGLRGVWKVGEERGHCATIEEWMVK